MWRLLEKRVKVTSSTGRRPSQPPYPRKQRCKTSIRARGGRFALVVLPDGEASVKRGSQNQATFVRYVDHLHTGYALESKRQTISRITNAGKHLD